MFCKFCGNELPDGAGFCTKCGKVVSYEEAQISGINTPFINDNEYTPFNEQDKEKESKGADILKFAILSLAFASSFYLSVLGLVFSIIARVKLKKYVAQYGETEGKATVGKHLSLVGLIVSIVLSVLCFILLFVIIFAGLSEFLDILSDSNLYV